MNLVLTILALTFAPKGKGKRNTQKQVWIPKNKQELSNENQKPTPGSLGMHLHQFLDPEEYLKALHNTASANRNMHQANLHQALKAEKKKEEFVDFLQGSSKSAYEFWDFYNKRTILKNEMVLQLPRQRGWSLQCHNTPQEGWSFEGKDGGFVFKTPSYHYGTDKDYMFQINEDPVFLIDPNEKTIAFANKYPYLLHCANLELRIDFGQYVSMISNSVRATVFHDKIEGDFVKEIVTFTHVDARIDKTANIKQRIQEKLAHAEDEKQNQIILCPCRSVRFASAVERLNILSSRNDEAFPSSRNERGMKPLEMYINPRSY